MSAKSKTKDGTNLVHLPRGKCLLSTRYIMSKCRNVGFAVSVQKRGACGGLGG